MNELAKRVVACKGWRWMAGMLVRAGNSTMRLDGVDVDGRAVRYERSGSDRCACYPGWPSEKVLPDLTDPATVGCLMQMLRDAYPTAEIRIDWLPADDTTTIRIDDGTPWLAGNGATLAEALVAALEAQRCPV